MYKYRENNVKKLKDIPEIISVDQRKVEFTLSFRIQLFQRWKKQQGERVIEEGLNAIGIYRDDISDYFYREMHNKFLMGGYPLHQGRRQYKEDIGYQETNPLLLSGKYHRFKDKWGLEIDPDFRNELKKTYPDISIEEKMTFLGLDPVDVGYNRIRRLKLEFEEEARNSYHESEEQQPEPVEKAFSLNTLYEHPYVKGMEGGNLVMREAFFNETCLLGKNLHEILKLYEIDESQISENSRIRIHTTLKHWEMQGQSDFSSDEKVLRIQRARFQLMNEKAVADFRELGVKYQRMPVEARRKVCRWIDGLKPDPGNVFIKKKILAWMGISKSQYYALLNDESYGKSAARKKEQDEKDIEVIRKVLEYKGFEKGIRQVYMLMPGITGEQFSIYRIRRLMNKYGIRTKIRRPSRNRRVMKELMERNRRSNLLLRRFRLHRPNEVRLTDVTYLDYGNGRRAYGSASIDPATGKVICFIVRENNDLQLALDTLEAMDRHPAKRGAILHSDQGILYLTDEFQAAVLERELNQSMSRRGNCWDNCPQEAFFGHFKDESGYEKCQTLEELQTKTSEYALYYNEERKIWERGKMTPVEYEAWLEGMSEEEFGTYLAQEEERYRKMKEQSAEKAVRSARERREDTLAALEEINEAYRS